MHPRSKRSGNSNWVLWVLILTPIIIIIMKSLFDPVITVGEIIGLAIAVPAAMYGMWRFVNAIIYRMHPFKMRYQREVKYEDKLHTSKEKKIRIGESSFILRIQPRRPTEFNDIHVRFVDKKSWYSTYPERRVIDVKNLIGEGLIGSKQLVEHTNDNTNGIQAVYQPIYHRSPQEALVLTVLVVANKEWNGYVVFRAKREDGHQGYAYLPIEVV